MPIYCVNTNEQPDSGDHEVHDLASTDDCLPEPENRKELGWHSSCEGAVEAAREFFADVNGCFYCANQCHTT